MREKNRKLEDIAKRSNIWFTFKGKPNLDKWFGKWSQDGAYNWLPPVRRQKQWHCWWYMQAVKTPVSLSITITEMLTCEGMEWKRKHWLVRFL